jgi:hypothetical protein
MGKDMLSHLFSVFSISNDARETSASATLPIRCDTGRLPKNFREKFQLGKYRIDESEGDIRIGSFDMDAENQKKFVAALHGKEKLLNFSEIDDEILEILKNFTVHHDHRTVIYLKIGGGIYCYPELFERLIVVKNGTVEWDLKHGYGSLFSDNFQEKRNLFHSIKDDRNVQQFLRENFDLGRDFCEGKVKIFVYHKPCRSLTSLYFNRHDDGVASIDRKRLWARRAKDVLIWGAIWKVGSPLASALSSVPLMGSVTGLVITFAGCVTLYKGYQLLCPDNIKSAIDGYITRCIQNKMPLLSGLWDSCKSIGKNFGRSPRPKKHSD